MGPFELSCCDRMGLSKSSVCVKVREGGVFVFCWCTVGVTGFAVCELRVWMSRLDLCDLAWG